MNRSFYAFIFMSTLFLVVNQYLGVVEDQSRLPFYCVFGLYTIFLAGYVILTPNKITISLFAKISIFLTVVGGSKCFFSSSLFNYYFFLYGTIFSLVLIFSDNVVYLSKASMRKVVPGVEFVLWCVFAVTFLKSLKSEEVLRYGLEINPVAPLAIPWILLVVGWKKVVLFLIAMGIAIFSGKRAQILSFGIIPISYFVAHRSYELGKKAKAIVIGIFAIVCGCVMFLSVGQFSDGTALSERFSSESLSSGSGRMESLEAALLSVKNMDFAEFIYGLSDRSMALAQQNGFLGHCDFLTIFLNYGIFALIGYLFFHLLLMYRCWQLCRRRSPFAFSYVCMTFIALILASVSFLFVPAPVTVVFCIYVGVFEGMVRSKSLMCFEGNRREIILK